MTKPQIINITITLTLILTIGLLTGYSIGYFRATTNNFPEIKFIEEINTGIPTIKLMEVKNGKLLGEVVGQKTRIAYSPDKIIDMDTGKEFTIPINEINLKTYYKSNAIPENAQFIASKNGKYYYSVFDKRAHNLSEKNRIYFSSASEAEKIGYLKK